MKNIQKNNEAIIKKINKIDEKINSLQKEKNKLIQEKKRNDTYIKEYQKLLDQQNTLIEKYKNGL